MRHIYADFIHRVAKPARYLGGEYQSVRKSADDPTVEARICLAFPDSYEIGMSHLGTKIIYSLLNKDPRIAAERCFTPWSDMEAELRERQLPLVSLESSMPLREFDVIGISLQYELTFTNVLTLLDLGGIPLRAADRAESDPLVLGGGPVASHPEPMAPFFDAFFVGEAEEELAELLLAWSTLRRAGRSRADALAELAAEFPLYVPSLYATMTDAETGMTVVGAPLDPRVPERVRRGVVANLDDYPFPTDAPVPYAEAVFDRAAVEIARGCTEGCRFCQAGMIYRPVRERSPRSIIDSVIGGVQNAGYDETALTCLSTADYSSVTPLVKEVVGDLKRRKVALSVSSLRAYGLGEEILDEMASMRISGLTFAPEAGTQRMRDVVNKNVGEHHIEESSTRIFSRGWEKLKLYFMIGLPTEEDIDVRGIVETGQRMLRIGRSHVGKRVQVTVSVSSHVPKPHTPFQWCGQDAPDEIRRKQRLLRDVVSERGLKLKYHNYGISFIEGVVSRGDRRLADVIELVWKRGARFDGWDELFDLERWKGALVDCGLDPEPYLSTRPVSARLPWDHIDVGLEDGFLLREYRKSMRNRLSPPCGKVAGQIIHPTNLADAAAEGGKLVCYDCGVACDLTKMRSDRIVALTDLGAMEPSAPRAPVKASSAGVVDKSGRRRPKVAFPEVPTSRYRLRFTKLGRAAFLGHLDTMRVLARLFRRAEVSLAYSRGFHPKPMMQFGPALALGVPSFGELMDIEIEGRIDANELWERMREVTPEGNDITGVWHVPDGAKKLAKLIDSYDLLVVPAVTTPAGDDAAELRRLVSEFEQLDTALVARTKKEIDVRPLVSRIDMLDAEATAPLCAVLGVRSPAAALRVRVGCTALGSAKPSEVATALGLGPQGDSVEPTVFLARLGFGGVTEDEASTAVIRHRSEGAGYRLPVLHA